MKRSDAIGLERLAEDPEQPDRIRVMAVLELLDGGTKKEIAAWLRWDLDRVKAAVASATERGEMF